MGRLVMNLPPYAAALALRLGPNDGGIQRGDRADTGDNEARPTPTGPAPAKEFADTPVDDWAADSEPATNSDGES